MVGKPRGYKRSKTGRGFNVLSFQDFYNAECSVQESSLAGKECIWVGIDNADPQVLASRASFYGIETSETCGWIPYPMPEGVLLSTRMHLTRAQARKLAHVLEYFANFGVLP